VQTASACRTRSETSSVSAAFSNVSSVRPQVLTTSQRPSSRCERRGGDRGGLGLVESALETLLLELLEDVRGPHGRVLQVGPRVPFEGEGVVEVEGDDLVSREAGHVDAQGADGDRLGAGEVDRGARLAGEDLLERLLHEPLDEVVGLDAEPLAPRHLEVGLAAVLVGKNDAERLGGTRGERDHLVGEVDRAVGPVGEPGAPDRFLDDLLRVGLPHVDDVDDGVAAPVAALRLRVGPLRVVARPAERGHAVGGDELRVAERRDVRRHLVLEVDPEEAELPELVGDVLAGVGDGAVRADEDLVGVLHPLEVLRSLELHDPAAGVLPVALELSGARRLQEVEGLRPELAPEDVALAGQEVVGDADPLHRLQVAADDRLREAGGERRRRALLLGHLVPEGGPLDGV
jgi:hypothetical protein